MGAAQAQGGFAELKRRFLAGEVNGSSVVWTDGMPGWVPISTIPELYDGLGGKAADNQGEEVEDDEQGAVAPQAAAAAAAIQMSQAVAGTSAEWFYLDHNANEQVRACART